jgi:hypothetical protein
MNDLEKDLKILIKKEKLLKKKLKKNKSILNFLNKDVSEKYNAKINVLPIRSGKNNVIEIIVKDDKYGKQDYSKKLNGVVIFFLTNCLFNVLSGNYSIFTRKIYKT